MQQEALKQATQMPQESQESEYMMPIYKPKTHSEDGEDAIYDFCFMPGTSTMSSRTMPNNLVAAKTLPIRGDAKVNNSTVRFKTHSPKLTIIPDESV